MNKIKLIDLVKSSGVEISDYKIHCAIDTSKDNRPLEMFFAGEFQKYQDYQTKKNFNKPYILSLIYLENNKWLFAGFWKKLSLDKSEVKVGDRMFFKYNTQLVDGLEHLTGRAIIFFEKNFRASYLIGSKYENDLFISELREKEMNVGDFPGYNSVRLSYNILKLIINEKNSSWKGALSNVSGIYVITDTNTGKHYVGSAYGGEGLWQRWSEYSRTGHGNNKELKKILKSSEKEYASNFQFSILEICDLNGNEENVIDRESHWKEVLKTRDFGLNEN
tara:strand:+ start:92 stop:922 length:831 start_codon:yes stop_codon:yes gene_type:complete